MGRMNIQSESPKISAKMFISYRLPAMHIHKIHWRWQENQLNWHVRSVEGGGHHPRSSKLVFLVTVNIDLCPLLRAVLTIWQLLTDFLIIMVLLSKHHLNPQTLYSFFFFLWKDFLVCLHFGERMVTGQEEWCVLFEKFQHGFVLCLGLFFLPPVLIPALFRPQCYPILTSSLYVAH